MSYDRAAVLRAFYAKGGSVAFKLGRGRPVTLDRALAAVNARPTREFLWLRGVKPRRRPVKRGRA